MIATSQPKLYLASYCRPGSVIGPGLLAVALFCAFSGEVLAEKAEPPRHEKGSIVEPPKGWPEGVREIRYPSSADGTEQPALFYAPQSDEPVPLLVGLHTWSYDYLNPAGAPYAQWCIEKGWAFIYPDFRGPNRRPEATGSELVVKDLISAVEYAKKTAKVDPRRIYLAGASGGGHAALLMAGRAPELWAGVSAWVGISDLAAWYRECKKAGRGYGANVAASCGGPPGLSPEVDAEYKKRSPLTWLKPGLGVALDINAGINDGHTGSVPISHSLNAFNAVAEEKDRLSQEQIDYFVSEAKVPTELSMQIDDADYGAHAPLFRRVSGNARITIFQGGHQIIYPPALNWLAKQKKEEK